jgi:hypothetical protein
MITSLFSGDREAIRSAFKPFLESMVTTTIVAGKVLMKDRKLLTIDEEEVTSNARRRAPEVWARYNKFVPN